MQGLLERSLDADLVGSVGANKAKNRCTVCNITCKRLLYCLMEYDMKYKEPGDYFLIYKKTSLCCSRNDLGEVKLQLRVFTPLGLTREVNEELNL